MRTEKTGPDDGRVAKGTKQLGLEGGRLSSMDLCRTTVHLSAPHSFLEAYLCTLQPQALVPSTSQRGSGRGEPWRKKEGSGYAHSWLLPCSVPSMACVP